jgi:hypothetical protein
MTFDVGNVANGFIGVGYAELTLVQDNGDSTMSGFPMTITIGSDGIRRKTRREINKMKCVKERTFPVLSHCVFVLIVTAMCSSTFGAEFLPAGSNRKVSNAKLRSAKSGGGRGAPSARANASGPGRLSVTPGSTFDCRYRRLVSA